MKIKEWALVLLAGIFTVGALNYLVRNKQEEEKEQTKIEAPARIDHSEFEVEGTYTTRALAEGDMIGGKWIRIVYDASSIRIVSFDATVEGFSAESGVGFGLTSGYAGGSMAFGFGYQFWGDSLEKYESGDYTDFYLVEGTHEVEFVSGGETVASATLTITNETKVTGFFGDNTGVEFLELIPN